MNAKAAKNLFDSYFDIKKKIHEYFGYKADWKDIPLEEEIACHWMLSQREDGSGTVVYSPEPLTEESIKAGTSIYGGVIYTQRFLPKFVYRTEDYTLISVDTQTDGNKFLIIFDNKKECTDQKLKDLNQEHWG